MITIREVQEQIRGLERTQAAEVWVRKDILNHILGSDAKKYIAFETTMQETPAKTTSLVTAMKLRARGNISTHALVCIDRGPALKAILEAVAKKASSPGKGKGGGK